MFFIISSRYENFYIISGVLDRGKVHECFWFICLLFVFWFYFFFFFTYIFIFRVVQQSLIFNQSKT